ncbi:tryptophan synthase subunit alpha [Riemerella columbina]|uniref:tryptophan synthase subunit alpha n=1 Tax=Riemerella columbina TaxID=103810 RepID=UPI00266ED73F|nr:tryptophan synthase subunit alpha [Riemerella columbina]WKS94481.1 tryptophan synthase subunit alpha [Riemerella columbina]
MKKLNIYFTAGIPSLDDTATLIRLIQEEGADFIEIGMPYSDPVADGEVIQQAHQKALANGMSIDKLFQQLITIKDEVKIPIILMGYINPVLSFGFEAFCQKCQEAGIYGLIIPDLPPIEFEKKYQKILKQYGLHFSFLVTPETSDERMLYLDSLSSGFLYAVSSSSTTGNATKVVKNDAYLKRLANLSLTNPVMIGFGIKNKADFDSVTADASGGIIGTAFVKLLLDHPDWETRARAFIRDIKQNDNNNN